MHTDYLDSLEAEAIYILREVAGQFDRPALLFSGGKDSIVLFHLALRSFRPGALPFALVHIDTGHNFPEVLDFRVALVAKYHERLIVRSVEETMSRRSLRKPAGRFTSRNALQTNTLFETIEELELDCCIGGGGRDEEKARAKERIFSFRIAFGQWDPKQQRPEVWNHLNGKIHKGENVRAFPFSNWTELDVWNYILRGNIELPSIYFSHEREVHEREVIVLSNGQMMATTEFVQPLEQERVEWHRVRYRTVGDSSCTAAFPSDATTVQEVISEISETRISERGATRLDDRISETGMEYRKRGGYF